MYEITNKTRSPIQLLVRSKGANPLTVLNIPGMGAGKNIYYLEDERHTPYIEQAEKAGFIKVKQVANKKIKGE